MQFNAMNTFAQDYVDENLAAFQAQITQLQGEYWHSCFPPCFHLFCICFLLFLPNFCPCFVAFSPLFRRHTVARYPAGAVAIIYSPKVTNRWNVRARRVPPTMPQFLYSIPIYTVFLIFNRKIHTISLFL